MKVEVVIEVLYSIPIVAGNLSQFMNAYVGLLLMQLYISQLLGIYQISRYQGKTKMYLCHVFI